MKCLIVAKINFMRMAENFHLTQCNKIIYSISLNPKSNGFNLPEHSMRFPGLEIACHLK